MLKRIFRSIFFVATLCTVLSFTLVLAVLYEYFTGVEASKLADETDIVANGVESTGEDFLQGLNVSNYRITWIDSDGTVIFDNEYDPKTLENHLGREEVSEALSGGVGESQRYSNTLATRTIYRAVRLNDGTVIRLAFEQKAVVVIVLGMIRPMVFILLITMLISGTASYLLSSKIVEPINAIDLDKPLENHSYEELSPLLTKIDRLHHRVDSQMEELESRRREFQTITNGMNEGLILINDKGRIISINNAARKFFDTTNECISNDILTLDRSKEMLNLINSLARNEQREEVYEKNSRVFSLEISPILLEKEVSGAVILVRDTTDKYIAEKQRREFSANVSHELKTPLHTIMGNAELIENGLVSSENIPQFAGKIRTEASRLVYLIDDIIRLSSLDEKVTPTFSQIDLLGVANEVSDKLSASCLNYMVTINVSGEHIFINGVDHLIYEIVYNLCDNAVKYNHKDGRVDVNVSTDAAGHPYISVSDTGIGIPEADIDRVFERFYRVDKSHSRETGGTGLGLSIVKHAAAVNNATVTIKSRTNEGTCMTVTF